jgi:hypothetical protein
LDPRVDDVDPINNALDPRVGSFDPASEISDPRVRRPMRKGGSPTSLLAPATLRVACLTIRDALTASRGAALPKSPGPVTASRRAVPTPLKSLFRSAVCPRCFKTASYTHLDRSLGTLKSRDWSARPTHAASVGSKHL